MKTKEKQAPRARIVRDPRDATRDYYIPLSEAEMLYAEGKLFKLELGSGYPNSYQTK